MNINWSRINMFQTCSRFYYWRFVRNLVPDRDAVPLIVGRAVHAGLASHYNEDTGSVVIAEADDVFVEAIDNGRWTTEEVNDLQDQKKYTKYILEMYRSHWGKEPWKVLAPEVKGKVALPGGLHHLLFRADGIISWRGHPWLLEHKTTSMLGTTFFKKFSLDGQITSYIWGVWKELGSRPVGAVINVIKKSRKLDRVEFARDVVMRTEEFVLNFMTMLSFQVDEIKTLTALYPDNPPRWLMSTQSCMQWNRPCSYTDLCRKCDENTLSVFRKRDTDYVDEADVADALATPNALKGQED